MDQFIVNSGIFFGGARPKANILDNDGHPWIAKFPSKNDVVDKALWEYLAYLLAVKSKINMSECRIEKVIGQHYTFFTQRFDREGGERIHFASAMTMAGNNEEILKDYSPSYLDIAEFIQFSGSGIEEDLNQLWRRMVFNIAISNTDDHLRNHGFLLTENGWRLSPAFDINPSVDKSGLSLNIDAESNALDFELAKKVDAYFKLNSAQMDEIILDIKESVKQWDVIANEIGISRSDRQLMESAFNCH